MKLLHSEFYHILLPALFISKNLLNFLALNISKFQQTYVHLMPLFQNYPCINYLILLVDDNLIKGILVIVLSLLHEIKKIKYT